MKTVEDLLLAEWSGVSGKKDNSWPYVLRWRTPVQKPLVTKSHPVLLQVLWIYADQNLGQMPSDADSEAMQVFEDRLCSTWEEQDTLAVLTAVLTFDGARQWVFYTDDIDECSYRLHHMPQEKDPYPLELSCQPDSEWSFLRTEVLKTVT